MEGKSTYRSAKPYRKTLMKANCNEKHYTNLLKTTFVNIDIMKVIMIIKFCLFAIEDELVL